MSVEQVRKLFGDEASTLFCHGQWAMEASDSRCFQFMSVEAREYLKQHCPREGTNIHCKEVLSKCYLAASVSILRSDRWFKNMLQAIDREETLSFCSSLRGLMEATGDALDITRCVALTLAEYHAVICAGVVGDIDANLNMEDLEDRLDHFIYATRPKKEEKGKYPKSYSAKPPTEYVKHLEEMGGTNAIACYVEMCDFTHPGRSSLYPWMVHKADILMLHKGQDEDLISDILGRYKDMFLGLIRIIYNPAMQALCVLNHFPFEEVHTPKLVRLNWDASSGWEKVMENLRKSFYYKEESYAKS